MKDVVGPVRYGGQLLIADQGVKVRTCRVAQAGLGNIGDDAMALVTPAEALPAQGEQQQACGKSLHPVDLRRGEPDCLRRFGVKSNNVPAARSTSVEAFRLRSPQARLPPAKGGAGFGEGVLQSHT